MWEAGEPKNRLPPGVGACPGLAFKGCRVHFQSLRAGSGKLREVARRRSTDLPWDQFEGDLSRAPPDQYTIPAWAACRGHDSAGKLPRTAPLDLYGLKVY